MTGHVIVRIMVFRRLYCGEPRGADCSWEHPVQCRGCARQGFGICVALSWDQKEYIIINYRWACWRLRQSWPIRFAVFIPFKRRPFLIRMHSLGILWRILLRGNVLLLGFQILVSNMKTAPQIFCLEQMMSFLSWIQFFRRCSQFLALRLQCATGLRSPLPQLCLSFLCCPWWVNLCPATDSSLVYLYALCLHQNRTQILQVQSELWCLTILFILLPKSGNWDQPSHCQ